MKNNVSNQSDRSQRKPNQNWGKLALWGTLGLGGLYGITAYVILPNLWRHYERNPKLEHSPKITQTADGIPGDPINIGLVGTEDQVIHAMIQAGWYPADPVTIRSSIGIAKSVLFKRSYPDAPVSSLFLLGRKQDLAFEQPVGSSAKTRHHVRLWQTSDADQQTQRPLWLGSATFDRSAGVSHLTGQITHHIESDIDAERDSLIQSLVQVNQVTDQYDVTGVGSTLQGRNGGGDWYYTDGEMEVAILPTDSTLSTDKHDIKPSAQNNPTGFSPIMLKKQFWQWFHHTFQSRD